MSNIVEGEIAGDLPVMDLPKGIETKAGGALANIMNNREVTEVLASIWIAKQFPRDHAEVTRRMRDACGRFSLADKAVYSFRRGDTLVRGGSIRLAETLLSAWGNAEAGWFEIERWFDEKEKCSFSLCKAFCFDKETNLYRSISFKVKHFRDLKDERGRRGEKKKTGYVLVDERDIYEMNANQASRRVRACIMQVIPEWLRSEAMEEIDKTLEKGDGRDPQELFRSVQAEFIMYGVTKERIEKFLGHTIAETSNAEIRNLGEIFNAIRDGEVKVRDYFPDEKANPKTGDDVIDPFKASSVPVDVSADGTAPTMEKTSVPAVEAPAQESNESYSLF